MADGPEDLRRLIERHRADDEALRKSRDRAVEQYRKNPTTFDPYEALDDFKRRHGRR